MASTGHWSGVNNLHSIKSQLPAYVVLLMATATARTIAIVACTSFTSVAKHNEVWFKQLLLQYCTVVLACNVASIVVITAWLTTACGI